MRLDKFLAQCSGNTRSEVKKWLKRNFKDVFLREGTAEQKGDVLYYIMSK